MKKRFVKYLDSNEARSYIECVEKINAMLKDFSEEQIDELETAFYGKHLSAEELYNKFLYSKPLFPHEMANQMGELAELMEYLDEVAKERK